MSGVVVGEADRQEAEDRYQRSRQHWEGGGGKGEGCRLDLFHAFLDLRDHHLDGDHGVVDQKPERDDQRAEGDALQADVQHIHGCENDGEDQGDGQGDDEPGPEAEAEEADRQHDNDRLEERLREFADRLTHDLGLVRHEVEVDADRESLHQALGRLVQALAEFEIVAALAHVDADADGRLAVDTKHLGGRIAVAALHLGDVRKLVEAPVHPQVERADAIRRQQRTGDVDQHVLIWRVDDSGRHHRILPGDRRQHVVEAELEIGELLGREVQIDLLVLVAVDVDLADVGRAQELGACGLGEVACLARGEAVIGDAVDDAEDVAELVVEEGPDHALRQRRSYVADLLADLVPDVVEVALGRRLLEVDENRSPGRAWCSS